MRLLTLFTFSFTILPVLAQSGNFSSICPALDDGKAHEIIPRYLVKYKCNTIGPHNGGTIQAATAILCAQNRSARMPKDARAAHGYQAWKFAFSAMDKPHSCSIPTQSTWTEFRISLRNARSRLLIRLQTWRSSLTNSKSSLMIWSNKLLTFRKRMTTCRRGWEMVHWLGCS